MLMQELVIEPKENPVEEAQTSKKAVESNNPPKTSGEPEVLIKREKYTLFHMLRNVLIFILIFTVLYFCSPIEIVSVSSSSMQPALPVGSVSIALKATDKTEYQVGDIVTFAVEYQGTYYSRITHRIISIDGDVIQTKGDNNPDPDPFTINKSQIRNILIWINIFKT